MNNKQRENETKLGLNQQIYRQEDGQVRKESLQYDTNIILYFENYNLKNQDIYCVFTEISSSAKILYMYTY